ncbi:MAG: arylsulfotransferase family protein, partial [Bradymonadaceae bacterium]
MRGAAVRKGSRIMHFDPTTHEVEWVYDGSAKRPFGSDVLGSQQMLPNGNVLITSSREGRIFEVSPSGRVVWEF